MPKRNIVWIAAIVLVAAITVWVTRPSAPTSAGVIPSGLKPLADTLRLIQEKYYGSLDELRLQRKAIGGMVSALDRFSSYLPPEKLDSFHRHMAGRARGLGVCLEEVSGKFIVIGPLLNSPAHRAKVYAGDELVAIDQKPLKGSSLSDVERLLDGPLGTPVVLTFLRRGQTVSAALTRSEFPMETVTGLCRSRHGNWLYYLPGENGIAYVRITEFIEDTGNQFRQICQQLDRPGGLVLDLRDNPGGYLEAAVLVADMFLADGIIVTEVRRAEPPRRHRAHSEGTYRPVPLVVLVNGKTASAGEIVAGALGQHGRAVLIGRQTLGKHSVQTMYPLGGELGQVNLTTSRFWIGRETAAEAEEETPATENGGITPHVLVELSQLEQAELQRLRKRAEVVPAPPVATAASSQPQDVTAPALAKQMVRMDPQLDRAVRLLRTPAKMEAILRKAAKKTPATRQVRVETLPAGRHE